MSILPRLMLPIAWPLALPLALALAGTASAQTYSALRTLVSPTLMGANKHYCTVTNVSSQSVALNRLQLVTVDALIASASCAGQGQSLAPGRTCTLVSPDISTLGGVLPFSCVAQHMGPENALVGAIQSFFFSNDGTMHSLGALPMSAAIGVTLAP